MHEDGSGYGSDVTRAHCRLNVKGSRIVPEFQALNGLFFAGTRRCERRNDLVVWIGTSYILKRNNILLIA